MRRMRKRSGMGTSCGGSLPRPSCFSHDTMNGREMQGREGGDGMAKTEWEFFEETFADPAAAEQAILSVGADPRGAAIMREKSGV